jgi:class 3 adenylate cyclase
MRPPSTPGPARPGTATDDTTDEFELRLFLEEICCSLCRFRHVHQDNIAPASVRIDQEVFLGISGAYADVRVMAAGVAPYFLEVKYGYAPERVVRTLARKYGKDCTAQPDATRVVLVYDTQRVPDWPEVERRCAAALRPGLALEVWDEPRLLHMIKEDFGAELDFISAGKLLDARDAIDRAKGVYAFGPEYSGTTLGASLLWHLDFWRLSELRQQQIRETGAFSKRAVLPPGMYHDVVVVMADLTGFSSFVRDTRDERVVRDCLTAFYAKSRSEVIDSGGMLYQFLGDSVIALFGIPDRPDDYLRSAVECAKGLSEVGDSVSNEWQRQIDRVQTAGGVHIGMAIGDLQVVGLRPFSRSYLGCIGDSINMAARLMTAAGSNDIIASNALYQRLDADTQAAFVALEPVEAKNVGRIKAWQMQLHGPARCPMASKPV